MFLFDEPTLKRAVAYYRHSAEDKQENSVAIQREQVERFAKENSIEIIHEEADEGKSGLTADRPGFQRLFNEWVLNPAAPKFQFVLVLDASRWGRFQDQDEAGKWTRLCRDHGKKVVDISRGLPKEDNDPVMGFITHIDRYMAAEYSKVLSTKVFYGAVKVSQQGYSAGGSACYGMTRLLLDFEKKPVRILKKGEWKSISNERVTFTPLNDGTTETVKSIFELLILKWRTPNEIAATLNGEGIPSANGGVWNREKILRILTNETYIGTRVYNKTWGRLRQKSRKNPRKEWVIQPNAFTGIVDKELFLKAQERIYLLSASKRRRGLNTIARVKRVLNAEIRQLLTEKGLEPQKIDDIAERLPVVFGVDFYLRSTPHWCFVINEPMRNHEFVLGIALAIDERDPVSRIFLIPTAEFTSSNFNLFAESDQRRTGYELQRKDLEKTILEMAAHL